MRVLDYKKHNKKAIRNPSYFHERRNKSNTLAISSIPKRTSDQTESQQPTRRGGRGGEAKNGIEGKDVPEQKYFAFGIDFLDMSSNSFLVSKSVTANKDFSNEPLLDTSTFTPNRSALLARPSNRRWTGASCRRRIACSGKLAAIVVATVVLARIIN